MLKSNRLKRTPNVGKSPTSVPHRHHNHTIARQLSSSKRSSHKLTNPASLITATAPLSPDLTQTARRTFSSKKGAKSVQNDKLQQQSGPVKSKASGVDYEFALPPSPHPNYEVVIGLETHAQISTATKMFSAASTTFKAAPNSNTSLFDAAVPGTLPRVNEDCVNKAILTGLALGGVVNQTSFFHRKQYFYVDMPVGYQITQNFPVISGGSLSLDSLLPAGMSRSVGISHIQLEHDSGKSLHDVNPYQTHVDLNRAGVALMEIVTTPTIYSAHEAVLYLKKLQSLLRVLGTSNANLEEGSMRCDVNVTVRRLEPAGEMSQRVEIKNMNSFKHILYAIQSEASRQITILESEYATNPALTSKESSIQRETRGYDHKSDTTHRLRSKENLLDYRFFPEPDLPPLVIDHRRINALKTTIPILPDTQFRYLMSEIGLGQKEANVVIQEDGGFEYFMAMLQAPGIHTASASGKPQPIKTKSLYEFDHLETGTKHAQYTESAIDVNRSQKAAHNWLTNELFGRIKRFREGNTDGSTQRHTPLLESNKITPQQLAEIIDLIQTEQISGKQAKALLDDLFNKANTEWEDNGESDEIDFASISPQSLAQSLNMLMDNDPVRIGGLVDVVVQLYPDEVAQFVQKDKKAQFGFLTGQVIKLSQQQEGLGEANPKQITTILTERLQKMKTDEAKM